MLRIGRIGVTWSAADHLCLNHYRTREGPHREEHGRCHIESLANCVDNERGGVYAKHLGIMTDIVSAIATRLGDSTKRSLAQLGLLLVVALFAGIGQHGVEAQETGHWVLSSTDINPAGDEDPPGYVVSMTTTSMSVTRSFGPDDTSGAEAQFDATWKEPPTELEPGVAMEIPVAVSGQVTGSRDTQFFFGLDVIMIVNGGWNNSAVGAGANCVQTTVISGEYVCSDPVANTGTLPYGVPSSGDTYTIAVAALNCGGPCAVEWSYVWEENAAADDAAAVDEVEDSGAIGEDAETQSQDSSDPFEVAPGLNTGVDRFPGGVIGVAAAAVAAAAAAAAIQQGRIRDSRQPEDQQDEEEDEPESVILELTYPVGRSPMVLQYGWLFGAKCIVGAGTPNERDVSDTVKWSGPATFSPSVGRRSRPAFKNAAGFDTEIGSGNTIVTHITLTVDVDGKTTSKTFPVSVISTVGYARLSDTSVVPADAHGCPACPHPGVGPIISASGTNVFLAGKPVATVGDNGVHAACCGPNTFVIKTGDARVLINGKPAAWQHSEVTHCGGAGYMKSWHHGGK
jgi:uncharacterized Zn-binding protein involved in type VI secretion